jgi:VanZ family protein
MPRYSAEARTYLAIRTGSFTVAAARIAAGVLAAAIIVLSVVPPRLRPETEFPHALEHFGIFFLTGMAFRLGWPDRGALVGFGLLLFTGGIELAQIAIPGRHSRLSDLLVDAAGALAGVAVVAIADRLASNSGSRS